MNFGQVRDSAQALQAAQSDPSFPIPTEPAITDEVLRAEGGHGPRGVETTVRLGLSTWGQRRYVGSIYPEGTARRDFLATYARYFATVELSGTFYALPQIERLRGWANQVPASFRFLPKVPKHISHELVGLPRRSTSAPLDAERADAAQKGGARLTVELTTFRDRCTALGRTLGPLLVQMPPSFAATEQNLAFLERVVAGFGSGQDAAVQAAVELRHPSWFAREFANEPLQRSLTDLLRHHGSSLVVTDTAGAREVLHSLLTAPRLVLRFVTQGSREFDEPRATAWIQRIREWADRGLHEALVYLHLGDDPGTTRYLLDLFVRELGDLFPPPYTTNTRHGSDHMPVQRS